MPITRAADGRRLPSRYVPRVDRRFTTILTAVDPRLLDWAPAVALCVLGQFSLWAGFTHEGPRAVTVPVALVVTLVLGLRRRTPVAVVAVVVAAWLVQAIAASSPSTVWELIVLMMAAYAPGAHAGGGRSAAGAVIALVGVAVVVALEPTQDGSAFSAIVLGGCPWLAGRLVRAHREQARELDALNAELERRRGDDLLAATRQERARIARELHDVIAHGISVMVVQAGAAEQVAATHPDQVVASLEAIRRTGKGALAEMRRLVGVLRTEGPEQSLEPQPGLGDLPALVERMRAAGLDARLELVGDAAVLDPGPDLAGYRVVQEALTNALKHGGRTRADVVVRYAGDCVDIDVVDAGPPAVATRNGGHGLIGMRERMALYGGSVVAGPRSASGWEVHARLPVEPSPAA